MHNFSIFAMGIMPYITASIIVQLLTMDVIPKFAQWAKEGEIGRRKISTIHTLWYDCIRLNSRPSVYQLDLTIYIQGLSLILALLPMHYSDCINGWYGVFNVVR